MAIECTAQVEPDTFPWKNDSRILIAMSKARVIVHEQKPSVVSDKEPQVSAFVEDEVTGTQSDVVCTSINDTITCEW